MYRMTGHEPQQAACCCTSGGICRLALTLADSADTIRAVHVIQQAAYIPLTLLYSTATDSYTAYIYDIQYL